eukprot:NODE_528_length_1393_cov_103.892575_g493_i0.p1 GENE.NODE_528_length_1393_cov_103.892575_g493_i0~~NODE_528_length_1393_cov_103.892575_g493_i0.p1  ORF type:complete len:424 (+),score=96.03 NODE_528_length_1393_cov_103.892575_g493_i0:74-1345(+)
MTDRSAKQAKKQWGKDWAIPTQRDQEAAEAKGKKPPLKTKDWPMLLKNYDKLNIRDVGYNPHPEGGYTPLRRPLEEYLKYGMLNLDKPANPSSHEVVSWLKKILNVERTGHAGTLDPAVTGCLIICLDRATRLVKSQQTAGKEYVAVCKFHDDVKKKKEICKNLETLVGPLFQRPPAISAVKRVLRIREIYESALMDFNQEQRMAVIWVKCEAGTYVRTFCVHLGYLMGVGAHMQELRRVRSGNLSEYDSLVTMHDVLDAQHLREQGNESYIRRVIMPCEYLLTAYKRLVIKDTCVNAVCYGAKLLIPGLLRYEDGIKVEEIVVLMTTKGEAVALGIALMASDRMKDAKQGIVAKLKRVIMDRDTYKVKWGQGPTAMKRKKLQQAGQLTKSGRKTNQTPSDWLNAYVNYSGFATNAAAEQAAG